jgi:hypothetical protein
MPKEDERLERAVTLVRQMSGANLKEQCLRTEWSALQTELERDLLCSVVSERAFWDDVKECANEDLLDKVDTGEADVDVDSRMLQMFRCFDKDGSGSIDSNEFHQMLLYMGVPLTDGEVREMIATVDSDQDGAISDQEFLHIMKHVLPQRTLAGGNGGAGAAAGGGATTTTAGAVGSAARATAAAKMNADAQRDFRSE